MPATNPLDELLTPEQTATLLGVSEKTLNVWRCTGRYNLPYVKIGSRVKYRKSVVNGFVERRTRNTYNGTESV